MIVIKTEKQIQTMIEGGKIAAEIHRILAEFCIYSGQTTNNLNAVAEELMKSHNVIPAFKGYNGYPNAICTSVNNQIVHGLPSNYELKTGDLISIDLGIIYGGLYNDSARSYIVPGLPSDIANQDISRITTARELIAITEQALQSAIEAAQAFKPLYTLSEAMERVIGPSWASSVHVLEGHGIGHDLHEDPSIPCYFHEDMKKDSTTMLPGMVLAIEPMVNQGSADVKIEEDGWTISTEDGSLSAHFEETVAITNDGPIIITR